MTERELGTGAQLAAKLHICASVSTQIRDIATSRLCFCSNTNTTHSISCITITKSNCANLVKSLAADVALERLMTRVHQTVVREVALLMKISAALETVERFVIDVESLMSAERR